MTISDVNFNLNNLIFIFVIIYISFISIRVILENNLNRET
jgi:hypothetical protein